MALTDKYVTAEQTGSGHAGTAVDPWSLADYISGHTRGMLVHVKAGTYTLTGVGANTIVGNNHVSGTETVGFPLILRGYITTPGDLDSGAVTTNQPVFTVDAATKYLQTSQYCSNVQVENITFTGDSATQSMSVQGVCRFRRCRFVNTAGNVSNPAHAMSSSTAPHYFQECYFENSQSYSANNGAVVFANNAFFVGCTFNASKKVAVNPTECLFSDCIFLAKNKVSGIAALTIGDDKCTVRNCVFDGFGVGVLFTRSTSGTVSGVVANNIFVNNTVPFGLNGSGSQTKFDAHLLNNASDVAVSFGDDAELLGLTPIALSGSPFETGTYELSDSVDAGLCKNAASPTRIQHGNTLNRLDVGAVQSLIVVDYPDEADVRDGVTYDNGLMEGSCAVPAAADVREDTPIDATVGTLAVPAPESVEYGVATDNTTGTYRRLMTFEDQSDVVTD